MDLRAIIANQIGTLLVSNMELTAEVAALRERVKALTEENERLRSGPENTASDRMVDAQADN